MIPEARQEVIGLSMGMFVNVSSCILDGGTSGKPSVHGYGIGCFVRTRFLGISLGAGLQNAGSPEKTRKATIQHQSNTNIHTGTNPNFLVFSGLHPHRPHTSSPSHLTGSCGPLPVAPARLACTDCSGAVHDIESNATASKVRIE